MPLRCFVRRAGPVRPAADTAALPSPLPLPQFLVAGTPRQLERAGAGLAGLSLAPVASAAISTDFDMAPVRDLGATVIAGFGSVGCDPPELAGYTDSAPTYSTGVAIAPNVPVFGAGHNAAAALRYAVEPALPGGLALDPDTGAVTGTPTAAEDLAAAPYTVAATNAGGVSTHVIAVAVAAGITFTHVSDFDTNGVLYHLATEGGARPYANPHAAGRVVASMSSVHEPYGSADLFVQHAHPRPVQNFTEDTAGSWMAVDLGEGRALRVGRYTLRHDDTGGCALRRWRLEGSADGTGWTTLKTHADDAGLTNTASMSTATWMVEAAGAFRHFRILQTGPNAGGNQQLFCAGIELYGTLRAASPQ